MPTTPAKPRPFNQPRIRTGIPGFDEVSGGGLPDSRTTLVVGGPGCGKTIFALQTLVTGVRQGVSGIFVAFEESSLQIIANCQNFKWDLNKIVSKKLFFLDAQISPDHLQAGKFDLNGILAAVKAKADESGARRVVFDGIDVLLSLLNDAVAERREIARLNNWLLESQLTGIVTAKTDCNMVNPRLEYLPFICDCVISLHHELVERVALRSLRILKYRGSNASTSELSMIIGPNGIEIASAAKTELDYPVSTDRVSSGVARLDTMLGGGYYRATGILISGQPGTAKSTLCGAFAKAACERGERTLYISYDESSDQIVRNFNSVNLPLSKFKRSGMLRMYSVEAESQSSDEHFLRIQALVCEHQPLCMVIDPLSSLVRVGGVSHAANVVSRIISFAKQRKITVVCTTLLQGAFDNVEATPLQISTIADTWIHLSYQIRAGERNRAITIVKSRGMGHSNQVRELVLSDNGIDLTDVYSVEGEVLMGTARWQRENQERLQQHACEIEFECRREQLKNSQAEALTRIELAKRELKLREAELEALLSQKKAQQEQWIQTQREVRNRRRADLPVQHGSRKLLS
ncbi:MAG TPA: circadian clock protein KaiC [Planctomycetota bacterium]|nr:circadian clock protein KaiC [Planctomycetota bacterium]